MNTLKLTLSNGEEKLYSCLDFEVEEKVAMFTGYTFADGVKVVNVEVA